MCSCVRVTRTSPNSSVVSTMSLKDLKGKAVALWNKARRAAPAGGGEVLGGGAGVVLEDADGLRKRVRVR